MDTFSQANHHFIPADFNSFDFRDLLDEYEQNGETILWHTGTKDGKRAHKFTVGDMCYFYYSNLPDGTSRIILKGVVTEANAVHRSNDETRGFRVGNISSVALKQPQKFDRTKLEKFYFGSTDKPKRVNQTQRYLCQESYRVLLEDLLADDDHATLAEVLQYFGD